MIFPARHSHPRGKKSPCLPSQVHRPHVGTDPFSTELVLERGNSDWFLGTERWCTKKRGAKMEGGFSTNFRLFFYQFDLRILTYLHNLQQFDSLSIPQNRGLFFLGPFTSGNRGGVEPRTRPSSTRCMPHGPSCKRPPWPRRCMSAGCPRDGGVHRGALVSAMFLSEHMVYLYMVIHDYTIIQLYNYT